MPSTTYETLSRRFSWSRMGRCPWTCFLPAHRLWPPEGGAAASVPGTRVGPGESRVPRAHLAHLGPWLMQQGAPQLLRTPQSFVTSNTLRLGEALD